MAKKSSGLGKGLDSLIPNFYDEDFDSNDTVSLEDMLNEDENEEDIVESSEDVEENSSNDEKIVESSEEESSSNDDGVSDDEESIEDESDDNEESIEEPSEDVEESSDDDNQEEVDSDDKEDVDVEDVETPSQDVHSDESDEEIVEDQIVLENVAEVTEIVNKNPRITLWSSQSAAVFRYLRKTEPEFSISKEASRLIDEAVAKEYPEIWELFEDI